MSHPLDKVNTTELVQMARDLGLGNLPRDRELLYAALEDDELTQRCPLEEKRSAMQKHIARNYARMRTQLPGCDGKCTTFGCPNLIVQRCWSGMSEDLL